jgi:hypothetical protein
MLLHIGVDVTMVVVGMGGRGLGGRGVGKGHQYR